MFRISNFALATLLLCFSQNLAAQSIRLHWSSDGQRCWFRSGGNADSNLYYTVDVANGKCEPAFDPNRLTAQLAKALGTSESAVEFRIRDIVQEDGTQIRLRAVGKPWRVELPSYRVTAASEPTAKDLEPRLFLPPKPSGASDESTEIVIENRLDDTIELYWIDTNSQERHYGNIKPSESRKQHTYVGHVWLLKSADKQLGAFSALPADYLLVDNDATNQILTTVEPRREGRSTHARRDRIAHRTTAERRFSRKPRSPNGKWRVTARDENLWLIGPDGETQLSTSGSVEDSFEPLDVRWSYDSRYLVAMRTRRVPQRQVYLVDSSPEDQLQPKLESYDYRKPGDALPTKTIHIFSVEDSREIVVGDELMENPWSLRIVDWPHDNGQFYVHYNQRGHQTLRLLEITFSSGAVRTVIDEHSETFLHYSDRGKSVCENIGGDEVLWASERSGWNHLYRYARGTGELLGAVTGGKWNVKRIEQVDLSAKCVWFYAVGIHPAQDPYHEHFCRVNFDGTDLRILTEGDGTHRIHFEQDGKYFLDQWSRVDMAPVTELRNSETGDLVCELIREDTSQRFTDRRITERFVAKGRDGKTDIWGIIHWPSNFDPEQSYPVVENIYAGPHDHHVPKSFRTRYRHQHQIADAGFIVVQIDGMGTAWRSKQFHDVCYKNLRDAGFPDRIAWMKAAAKEYPQMDLTRVGIYGGSAGGQNAMAALLWHHDFYKVAVADCGCHDNRMDKIWWNEQWMGWPVDDSYRENSNTEHAGLLQGQLMLIVGELDRNVDPASTTQVVKRLIDHDKDFEFVLVAGAGHGAAETPWASKKRLRFLKEHLLTP